VEKEAFEQLVARVSAIGARVATAIVTDSPDSPVKSADITGETVWAAMMQVGHTPHADEVALVAELRHISAIDHEGEGVALIGEVPNRPRRSNDAFVHELFDTLMHGHWLQGTLRHWSGIPDSALLVGDISRLFPFTNEQWVSS
jgi:hypothetical protein